MNAIVRCTTCPRWWQKNWPEQSLFFRLGRDFNRAGFLQALFDRGQVFGAGGWVGDEGQDLPNAPSRRQNGEP